MIVNGRKTKGMLIGAILKDPPPYVILSGTPVECITSFKLLGMYVASDLKWGQHIDANTSKAGKLLLITNRKSHMSFRLVPKSVTLYDLERRNSPN